MPRVLRFALFGCSGLFVLVVLVGTIAACGTGPSSPPERGEQDEGVEGGGKEPEEKKPLQGEKAKQPQEEDQREVIDVRVEIETSGGAGYGGNIATEEGTETLKNTYEDSTHHFELAGGTVSVTVVRLTAVGKVDVTLFANDMLIDEQTADDEDDTVNMVWEVEPPV